MSYKKNDSYEVPVTEQIAVHVKEILRLLGEDESREGLLKTPERVAKSLQYLTKGYAEDGSDCGPYAGSYPYVLSGYPLYVPRFESIEIPSSPTNGKLNIRLTIKNQNE